MPVPDPHPDVFDTGVAAAGRRHRPRRPAAVRRRVPAHPGRRLRPTARDGLRGTHPLWIVRRTMIDLIRPIEFQDMLRMRRWCSGTSNRWCEMRVRIDGRHGGLMESEAFWININRETRAGAHRRRLPEGLQRTTVVDRLRWKAYLKAGAREDATQIRDYPVGSRHRPVRPREQLGLLDGDRGLPLPHPELLGRAAAGHHRARRRGGVRRQTGDPRTRSPRGSTDKFGPSCPTGLLQRSHTWSATRRKRSPRCSPL